MKNLIVKQFNGSEVHTFIWKGKPCWIANQIVGLFNYADTSATIKQCIEVEDFESSVEYEVLIKEELKYFKEVVEKATKVELVASGLISKYASHLTIFYEDGLYGFLQYTDKPVGVSFRKWLRREVLPEIRRTGSYIGDESKIREQEVLPEVESLDTVNESVKILTPLLAKAGIDSDIQLLTTVELYKKAGVNIPVQIEAKEMYYDTKQIAREVKIYSKSNKPHLQAVGIILSKLEITEAEKKVMYEKNGGWEGAVIKYSQSVIEKVLEWLVANEYPEKLEKKIKDKKGEEKIKTFHVVYRHEEVASC